MNSTFLETLTERWWIPVFRGIAAIIFGVLALVAPKLGLLALVVMWGVCAIVDGAFNLSLAGWASRAGGRWGWYVFEGLVSIAAGVFAFAYPGLTAMARLFVIAAWAIVTGIIEIAASIELRHAVSGEWMLALAGVLSIALGILLFVHPASGALAVVWLIGLYAVAFGSALIGLGVRLHSLRGPGGRMATPGGTPSAA